ncbi:hypothetical protein [Streptomyces cylindrosporus]|uniref:Uncharacterized protein n=1 Tax=Streptomyces cylindrosporus TaxID=2927583 RepID=A0ABS9YD49_9ACTN|nr:hypothetical protein [Streptomyces cylindrosporus]MCI3275150.1 hypothetical protein [Streptomyces cylindrosporus]
MTEVLSGGGPDRPPWKPPRWLLVTAVVCVAVAAVVAGLVTVTGGHAGRSAAPRSSPRVSASPTDGSPLTDSALSVARDQTPGLVITGKGATAGRNTLNRHDRTATTGPWTVTVRRSDTGSLGHDGAVVTYPVHKPPAGSPIRFDKAAGSGRDGEFIWPLGDSYARVRGDLPWEQLAKIADATSVVSGRPEVKAPAGFSVVSTGPARPHVVREARYGSQEVGEARELGNGLLFTGVVRCGGVEDRLYAVGARAAGTVHGRPAVVTDAVVGNAILAWEPEPGVVAYVGYSGAALDRGAIEALRRTAERTRLLSARQWQGTRPMTVDQRNDFL